MLVVDLDGTLALPAVRSAVDPGCVEQDEICEPVARLVRGSGYPVVVISARPESMRAATERWLDRHHVETMAVLLASSSDQRSDVEIKRDLYLSNLYGRVNVAVVIDDRAPLVAMWRSLGLLVLHVAGR